ncbi:type II toxin-antitoxin system RelE/ParE family toxin [Comamonadaceae bacterium OH2545_COT-014]|nr:type II toxin-antitoxin system RelE/ParE family toxin [Comamonadaceae bacterium OH2545_COT-014]
MKPLRRHWQATHDVQDALSWYLEHAGDGVAERFLLDYEAALTHIARQPGTGSLRYAQAPAHAGLRFWLLGHFPFAVFYMERDRHIDVLRVLHQSSHLPRHLNHPTDP